MTNFLQEYHALLNELNGFVAESQQRFGSAIQCRRGCASCCQGLFDIGVLDALLLHAAWRQLPEHKRNRVEDAAERLLSKITTLAPHWDYPHFVQERNENEIDRILDVIGLQPCPLLDTNGACSLYAHRPFYCRVHGLKLRDASGKSDIETSCALNFLNGTPAREMWPQHDFTGLFRAEGVLIAVAGLDADARFLIPSVVTRRFAPYFECRVNLKPATP